MSAIHQAANSAETPPSTSNSVVAQRLRLVSSEVRLAWADASQQFLEYGRNVRHYSEQTLIAYGSDLAAFGRFLEEQYGTADPGLVTSAHLEDFLQSRRGLSPATKCRRLDCISTFFKYLARHGLADRNPAEGVPRPKRARPLPKWVPAAEVEALREVTRGALERAVFEVLAGLGLRRQEVIDLRVTDFDWREETVRVRGKGQRERNLPIRPQVQNAIEAYLRERPRADLDALFITRRGVPMTAKVLAALFRRLCKRASLADRGYTLHSLRHGFATNLSARGADPATIRDLMGHESLETTSRYLHSDARRKREAVSLLDAPGQRMLGDGPVQVVHGQREVVGRRVKSAVAEKALQ